jgi:isopentenyl phosphate kinase
MIVSTLRHEGIEAVSVHPLMGMVASDGELSSYCLTHLSLMMDLGIVPVLHGDVVMDTKCGACIVSGDQLVRVMAHELGIQRIGLATDVPGLLNADGSVVRELCPSLAQTMQIGGAGSVDVTGECREKLENCFFLRIWASSQTYSTSLDCQTFYARLITGEHVSCRRGYEP